MRVMHVAHSVAHTIVDQQRKAVLCSGSHLSDSVQTGHPAVVLVESLAESLQ